jgi:hypothetical protein
MLLAEVMKAAASPICAGSLNIWKPIAESASCRYVERSVVKAVGTPPTRPRQEITSLHNPQPSVADLSIPTRGP